MPSLAHAAESRERSAILDHMLAGSNVVAGVDDVIVQRRRDLLLQAMDGYSLDQLRKIDANGVKFRLAELKPKNLKPHQTYDQGKYDYEVHYRDGKWSGKRQIILDKSTFTDSEHPDRAVHVASHELAHAWDDAQYADTLKVNKITCLQSDSKDAVYVDPDGKGWSIQDMYRKYANEVRPLVRAGVAAGFDGKGNPVGYSLASEKEFYAEGYAVFHGNDAEARGRLQQHASELYALLNQEAEKQGTLPPR